MTTAWAHGTLPALFIDAECALCTRSAWFIDQRDRRRTVRFVALASAEGRALVVTHPRLASVDSLVWLEGNRDGTGTRAVAYSAAVLAVGRYLGGAWSVLARVGWLVPRPLRDAAYRVVAKHRLHLGPSDLA